MKYEQPIAKLPKGRTDVFVSKNRGTATIVEADRKTWHTITVNRTKRGSHDWWAVISRNSSGILFDGMVIDAEFATTRQVLTCLAEKEGLI
jgi:hypothetical protein